MKTASNILFYRIDDHVYDPGGTLSRWQTNLQLHYTYTGSVAIQVDSEHWVQHAGEICLLLPGHQEHFQYSETEHTHHGFCTAAGVTLSEETVRLYEGIPRNIKTSPRIKPLTDLARTLYEEKNEAAKNLYNQIAEMIFAEFFYSAGIPSNQSQSLPSAIQRAQDFIGTHYTEPFTLPELAEFCFVSQGHLIRLFKEHLQTTPIRYLWAIRLQHAVEKLTDTRLNVSEIAFQCGFVSPDHFSRLFKQHFKLSPLQYRKNQQHLTNSCIHTLTPKKKQR
ncbi:AraC family transcriptional regulator [Tichowtungia aerotolerans]|uniref:Helix-turn-helix domain-containing protein n=1 Tax=Tichowtungia aerotolerans TaxID=2697043 RepID=A0A6P1MDU3_9BACT|nr:AraC family transcriptional regulator [Tichowtungia aerotolerans]QHI70724.1 helix-turn-helix domain-containing protein [Tichowtungia aerotolerans]